MVKQIASSYGEDLVRLVLFCWIRPEKAFAYCRLEILGKNIRLGQCTVGESSMNFWPTDPHPFYF